jgi:hypothetical protein
VTETYSIIVITVCGILTAIAKISIYLIKGGKNGKQSKSEQEGFPEQQIKKQALDPKITETKWLSLANPFRRRKRCSDGCPCPFRDVDRSV